MRRPCATAVDTGPNAALKANESAPSPERAARAALAMAASAWLFASMGLCVRWASDRYHVGELLLYRGLVGVVLLLIVARWRGIQLSTRLPTHHASRSITGVLSLGLWFYAITTLPLGTAVTLTYTSSVWMALFLMGGAVLTGAQRLDLRLVAAVLLGFGGVVLLLQPTLGQDTGQGALAGLASGVLAALAYLQVAGLSRMQEPDVRIVFYFCVGMAVVGAVWSWVQGFSVHTAQGLGLLLAIGVLATLGQWLMTHAYAVGNMLANASLQYLGIVFSALYGAWLFQEPLHATSLLGMALIVAAGVWAALLRARQSTDVARAGTGACEA
jgi:drug/metabolite transporter (DMT)-like permease